MVNCPNDGDGDDLNSDGERLRRADMYVVLIYPPYATLKTLLLRVPLLFEKLIYSSYAMFKTLRVIHLFVMLIHISSVWPCLRHCHYVSYIYLIC